MELSYKYHLKSIKIKLNSVQDFVCLRDLCEFDILKLFNILFSKYTLVPHSVCWEEGTYLSNIDPLIK